MSLCTLDGIVSRINVSALQETFLIIRNFMYTVFQRVQDHLVSSFIRIYPTVRKSLTRLLGEKGPLMMLCNHENFGNIATFLCLFVLPLITLRFGDDFLPLTVVKSTLWLFGLDVFASLCLKFLILASLFPLFSSIIGNFELPHQDTLERQRVIGAIPACISYQYPCYFGFLVCYTGLLFRSQSVIWFMSAEVFAQLGVFFALFSDNSIACPVNVVKDVVVSFHKKKKLV